MNLLQLSAFLLGLTAVWALPKENLKNEIDYRLPDDVIPIEYKLDLTFDDKIFANFTFSGVVTITIERTNTTQSISLHAAKDFITIGKITVNSIENSNYSIDAKTSILKILQPTNVEKNLLLKIDYTGKLSTTDMYGLYSSTYNDKNGNLKHLAATQFEPPYARRMFPCFDEPRFKAPFEVTVKVPEHLNVLFNTEVSSLVATDNGTKKYTFKQTPKMATYLVALVISEFTCSNATGADSVKHQVCSRDETKDTRGLAIQYGPQLLQKLGEYLNYNYSNSEIKKMDQVAIPDFAAGAMENWGLVTYKERALLWDNDQSSNSYKQNVVTVIAHEFAHQWFGDLVTLQWWSETFLNEGFATLFEFFAAHMVVPEWELDKQYRLQVIHAALAEDALESAQALKSECSSPAEILAKFGTISYEKGGSVLNMVKHVMGETNFRKGLQKYISTHKDTNTVNEDLWIILNVFTEDLPGTNNLSTIMKNWVENAGYPVLNVKVTDNKVFVSQKRFLATDVLSNNKWYVPISYTVSVSAKKFLDTKPTHWLTPEKDLEFTVEGKWNWIILNNQGSSYYRVNYDESTWKNIKTALSKNDFDGIVDLNRAQIVDDVFNLAEANQLKYSIALDLIKFLKNDNSYYSWHPAFQGFNFLLKKVGQSSSLGQAISSQILELMAKLYASVPFGQINENEQIYTLKQVLALSWACKLGHEKCVEDSRKLFSNYHEKNEKPNKNLKGIVYCNALRHNATGSVEWEFLWKAYLAETLATERTTILNALGCTKNVELLNKYLLYSIANDSNIRPQDASLVFTSVLTANSENVEVAYKFLIENYKTISEKYKGMNALGKLIKTLAGYFTTENQIKKLKEFVETSEGLDEDFKIAASESMVTANKNVVWLKQFESQLKNYYGINSAPKIGSSVLIAFFAVALLKFFVN